MDSNSVFNWCLIGTGTLANKAANVVLSSGQHKFTAVYTRDFQKGLAFTVGRSRGAGPAAKGRGPLSPGLSQLRAALF